MARRTQLVAQARGAPVLPHDRVVHRLTGAPVPHHGRLALVGKADGRDVAPRQPGLRDRLDGDPELRRPDLVGIVLDPARPRKDLPEFLLRDGLDLPRVIEHDRAGTRGALVEREHVLHAHLRLRAVSRPGFQSSGYKCTDRDAMPFVLSLSKDLFSVSLGHCVRTSLPDRCP